MPPSTISWLLIGITGWNGKWGALCTLTSPCLFFVPLTVRYTIILAVRIAVVGSRIIQQEGWLADHSAGGCSYRRRYTLYTIFAH